jgi:hypothetical protein
VLALQMNHKHCLRVARDTANLLDTWADFASYRSASEARGESFSETERPSSADGTSQTLTEGRSTSHATGSTESIHQRRLVQPGEVGGWVGRVRWGGSSRVSTTAAIRLIWV